MASPIYEVTNAAFAMTTGAKTVLCVIAGANQNIAVVSWGISFDGITASAVPATVDICQSTQATAGTTGATPTAVQRTGRSLAFQGSCGSNYTAQNTALTPLQTKYIAQFMGLYETADPLGYDAETDFSGGTVRAICLRANVTAAVNCLAWMRFTLNG